MTEPLGLDISRETPEPIYLQVAQQIRARVLSGAWPTHHRLKPEAELAADLGISRGSLRHAVKLLQAEGLIVQVQGRGTFVASPQERPPAIGELVSLSELMTRHRVSFVTKVIECRPGPVRPDIVNLLGQEEVLRLRRLRSLDDGPAVVQDNQVVLRRCPSLVDCNFEQESLFGYLENKLGLELGWAERTFDAGLATGAIAEYLELPEGSPVLLLEQLTHLASGDPIEFSTAWIRTDRYKLSVGLSRQFVLPTRVTGTSAGGTTLKPRGL